LGGRPRGFGPSAGAASGAGAAAAGAVAPPRLPPADAGPCLRTGASPQQQQQQGPRCQRRCRCYCRCRPRPLTRPLTCTRATTAAASLSRTYLCWSRPSRVLCVQHLRRAAHAQGTRGRWRATNIKVEQLGTGRGREWWIATRGRGRTSQKAWEHHLGVPALQWAWGVCWSWAARELRHGLAARSRRSPASWAGPLEDSCGGHHGGHGAPPLLRFVIAPTSDSRWCTCISMSGDNLRVRVWDADASFCGDDGFYSRV
jgi:hypothetical protein